MKTGMEQDILNGLKSIDREMLMERMITELPDVKEKLKLSSDAVADKLGMDIDRFMDIETGRAKMKWSEYMSLLFLLFNDPWGRRLIDSKGLFPEELRRAMSVNRNEHKPSSM